MIATLRAFAVAGGLATASWCALAPATATAQSRWEVDNAKSASPPHAPELARLPPGSLIELRRSGAKASGPWSVPGFDAQRWRVADAASTVHPNGDISWSGTIEGAGAAYPVFVTEGPTASFGQWVTPHGRYRFESSGDRAWLVREDHPQLVRAPIDELVRDAHVAAATKRNVEAGTASTKAGEAVIDVMFVHTAAFPLRYPGPATTTRVNHLVGLANQIFANSDIGLVLRLVAVDMVGYPEAGDNLSARNAMRDALDGRSVAGFETLRARRVATGADLVTLIRAHDVETRGNCGIAYFPGQGPAAGVNVLSDGISSWSICSEETYAHEVGHNLGAEHQNGANSASAGFATAHVVLGRFHTVMGSFGTGSPDRSLRLARFSNPRQRCGGRSCGVENVSDNARKVTSLRSTIAAYAVASSDVPVPQAPAPQDPDIDGDGVAESEDAFPYDASLSADRDGDGVGDPLDAFPDDPARSSDLDRDGLADPFDPDIDGDGIANTTDALPRDPTETLDADGDGVGDGADAFDADRREADDLDGDGIGDNADPDGDGDGLPDFAPGAFDLLVASIGNDRVLRLDGDTGRLIATEIAEPTEPVALGSTSSLAWNPYRRRVDATIASELRRYDAAARRREARVLRSFRGSGIPGLRSGLTAAMTVDPFGEIIAADAASTFSLHRFDAVQAFERPGGRFSDQAFFADYPRALVPNGAGGVWAIDRRGTLSEVAVADGALRRRFELAARVPAIDPRALAIDAAGRVLVADASVDQVLRVDPASGETSVLVAAGSGGLRGAAGLAIDAARRLYVSSSASDQVLRYSSDDGSPLGVFSRVPAGRLSQPRDLVVVPRVADRYPRDAARRYRPRAGAWSNPSRSAQGIDLQHVEGGLGVAWYTYDADGRATWYIAVGGWGGARWSAPLQRFRWDGQRAIGTEVGTLELEFASESEAAMRWILDGQAGEATLRQIETGDSLEPQFPTAIWSAPATPGWGYSVTRIGATQAVTAFLFDRQGRPTWALGVGSASASEFALQGFQGGACPSCAEATPTARVLGTVRFAPLDDERAAGAIVAQDASIDWRFDAVDLRRLTATPTTVAGDPRP